MARGELNQTWAGVFFAPEKTPPKIVLITAAERGEGVTQIVAGLGVVGAESNPELKILLVDFNLRSPGLADALGIEARAGVADVIRHQAALAEAIHSTDLPNLSFLSAGQSIEQPLALLRSPELRSVLKELSEQYDHVLLDVAPANSFPDAQILAGCVDGTVLVTHTGVTRRETVAEAKKRIEQSRGRLLGVVLNQRRFPIPAFLYKRV